MNGRRNASPTMETLIPLLAKFLKIQETFYKKFLGRVQGRRPWWVLRAKPMASLSLNRRRSRRLAVSLAHICVHFANAKPQTAPFDCYFSFFRKVFGILKPFLQKGFKQVPRTESLAEMISTPRNILFVFY